MMVMTIDTPPVFRAPDLPKCRIAGAGPVIGRMAGLPETVRHALVAAVGGAVAEAGAPFHASDVVRPNSPPRTRFLRAYRVRDRWLVWIEQGGIAQRFRVLAFRDAPKGTVRAVPVPGDGKTGLCKASQQMAVR